MNPIAFDSDTVWRGRFNEYLRGNKRAQDALRSLVDAGIPEDWLLTLLHLYANPRFRQEEQLRQRRDALASCKEVDGLLRVLSAASGSLDSFAESDNVYEWARDHRFSLRGKLSQNLTEYREALVEVRKELAKFASAKGEGVSDEPLVGLVEAITSVTGEPQWGSLAYLVECSYFAHDRRCDADRDLIRKRCHRFVKNFPRLHESWLGKDWHTFFGIPADPKHRVSTDPQAQMDHFIQRFAPKKRVSKPRYGKIHLSTKR